MTHEELKSRVDELHKIMSDPQPGIFHYQLAIGQKMQELVDAWNRKGL